MSKPDVKTLQWDDIYLQNHVQKSVQRSAFRWAIRALKPPPAPPKGRDLRHQSPLKGAVRAPRLFIFEKLREFLTAGKGQKSGARRAIRAPRHRNEHAVMLQRGRRQNAVRAPLQPRGALAGGPHPARPKGRETCVIVSGCVITSCKSGGFSAEKTA